jgi:hypothetical protein
MTPGRIWLGCLGVILLAVAAIYALSDLVAFLAVTAIVVWLGGIVGGLAAVGAWADEHKRADAAQERAEMFADALTDRDATIGRLEAECNNAAAENARLTEERLTDPATATTVPVPLLRAGKGLLTVVPPVTDEDDYWARLMKATEERS